MQASSSAIQLGFISSNAELEHLDDVKAKILDLFNDERTFIDQSPIAGDITVQNSSGNFGSWGRIKLFQLKENYFAIDGAGIRLKINSEELPERMAKFFTGANEFFKERLTKQKLVILDYGSQYTGNISSILRKSGKDNLGINIDILDQTISLDEIKDRIDSGEIKGIIISGGPASVEDSNSPKVDPRFFTEANLPVLGICYGMQAMATALGGELLIKRDGKGEYGPTQIHYYALNPLIKGLKSAKAIMSHKDTVLKVPKGFKIFAETPDIPIAGMCNIDKKLYGIQFHPEVSPRHQDLLSNFAFDICGMKATQNHYDDFIEKICKTIKDIVQDKEVFLAVSGGVDSTVTAFLLNKAIGGQAHFYICDHGFMRKDEVPKSVVRFAELGIKLEVLDVSEAFFESIKGLRDPEQKRKAIGAKFIDVFHDQIEHLAQEGQTISFFAQGTILSDVMESGKKKYCFESKQLVDIRDTVKSHHNVGGLPDELKSLDLLEPIKDLFKDEVRIVGDKLGIPHDLLYRRPFPGPGLAIRVPNAEVTPERIEKIKLANYIFDNAINKAKNIDEVWQSLTALLVDTKPCDKNLKHVTNVEEDIECRVQPLKVVGTKGDGRSHEYPMAIKDNGLYTIEKYREIAREITNSTPANRVLLQLEENTAASNDEGIVMRAIHSVDAMTATVVDLSDVLSDIAQKILLLTKVKRIYYDITDKPPGTVEFE